MVAPHGVRQFRVFSALVVGSIVYCAKRWELLSFSQVKVVPPPGDWCRRQGNMSFYFPASMNRATCLLWRRRWINYWRGTTSDWGRTLEVCAGSCFFFVVFFNERHLLLVPFIESWSGAEDCIDCLLLCPPPSRSPCCSRDEHRRG